MTDLSDLRRRAAQHAGYGHYWAGKCLADTDPPNRSREHVTRTIWKYSLTDAVANGGATTDHPVIAMPKGAQVLSVQAQQFEQAGDVNGLQAYAKGEDACIWALVSPDAEPEPRVFVVVGTGNPVPDDAGRFVGTWQQGPFVFHLFEQATGWEGGYRVDVDQSGAIGRKYPPPQRQAQP